MRSARKNRFFFTSVALILVTYITCFYIVRDYVIDPFESGKVTATHSVRPVYNIVFYPLRAYASKESARETLEAGTYYGFPFDEIVQEYSFGERLSKLDLYNIKDGEFSISFYAKPSVLDDMKVFQPRDYIQVDVSHKLSSIRDRYINTIETVEFLPVPEVPRLHKKQLSSSEITLAETRFSQVTGPKGQCTRRFVSDYKDLALQHCLQDGYAENIGGGCFHLLPYFATSAVLNEALNVCFGADYDWPATNP